MTKTAKSKKTPVAVLISDIHFAPNTLELATAALQAAQARAYELKVPLIIAGDLTDTKAIIRGEVANRLIDLFSAEGAPGTYVIVGNHDRLNEKAPEHSLNFLRPYVTVVDEPVGLGGMGFCMLPYYHDTDALRAFLFAHIDVNLIMHQGLLGADMGHYVQDKTSLPPEAFAGRRVISGHYHKAQDIELPGGGLWSYIGSPFTMTFGEANDGPKGFRVLYSDGSLELVPTGLRKHIVAERDVSDLSTPVVSAPGDLIWLKVRGPSTELAKLNKDRLAHITGTKNFKLEKLPTDSVTIEQNNAQKLTGEQLLDALIDETAEAAAIKAQLKALWRSLV